MKKLANIRRVTHISTIESVAVAFFIPLLAILAALQMHRWWSTGYVNETIVAALLSSSIAGGAALLASRLTGHQMREIAEKEVQRRNAALTSAVSAEILSIVRTLRRGLVALVKTKASGVEQQSVASIIPKSLHAESYPIFRSSASDIGRLDGDLTTLIVSFYGIYQQLESPTHVSQLKEPCVEATPHELNLMLTSVMSIHFRLEPGTTSTEQLTHLLTALCHDCRKLLPDAIPDDHDNRDLLKLSKTAKQIIQQFQPDENNVQP